MSSDRKLELERKKAKLQAMREEKKRKDLERKQREENEKPSLKDFSRNFGLNFGQTEDGGAPGAAPRPTDLRSETDKMLQDLGIPAAASPPSTGSATTPASAENAISPQETGPVQAATTRAKKISLGVSKVTQTNIAPREMVVYSKETQTRPEQVEREARPWDYYEGSTTSNSPLYLGSPNLSSHGSGKFMYPHMEWDDEFSSQDIMLEQDDHGRSREPDDDNDSLDVGVDTPPISINQKMAPLDVRSMKQAEEPPAPKQEDKPAPVRELTDEEKRKIMNTEDFMRFFERSSRIIERSLDEQIDIFTDYAGGDGEDMDGGLAEGEKLKLSRTFFDDRWSRHRTVTCMDWSTQYPELLVASYNCNEDAPHEPDGVALIWNSKYKKDTPEYIFHCQSSVMSSCFAKFHPNLIIGGTYSGQIVLWDNRSNKRTPVQRTPLSAAAHTHPVYCVNVVGTQNAHNLISVSTDGKMCSWSLDMLSQPQDSMELQFKQSKAVAVTSFSFLSGDVNNFVVGSEEGAVYTACRHGSKAGISDMFEGHQGPVTGIDCNSVPGAVDFSHYFISSSFDWTVKLWNIKENRPLYSFEDNSEYVYDAKWSPINPALFATVDGSGRLDLWNLNNDTEVPTASIVVDSQTALNRCRWHQSGKELAVGDDVGKIHIYDIAEQVATPRLDEWTRFVHTLGELKNEQAEDEDSGNLSISASPLR